MDQVTDQMLTPHRPECHNEAQRSRPRNLHQSDIHLGDESLSYSTTYSQTYSGRSPDGRPLVFRLRDPAFPSQFRSQLDLSTSDLQGLDQSHSAEVHGPKPVTVRTNKMQNWVRHRSGNDVRAVLNPQNQPESRTSTSTSTRPTMSETDWSTSPAGGKPTQWHQHDIVTGEPKQVSRSGSFRLSRDKELWATRRWESDSCGLRLY